MFETRNMIMKTSLLPSERRRWFGFYRCHPGCRGWLSSVHKRKPASQREEHLWASIKYAMYRLGHWAHHVGWSGIPEVSQVSRILREMKTHLLIRIGIIASFSSINKKRKHQPTAKLLSGVEKTGGPSGIQFSHEKDWSTDTATTLTDLESTRLSERSQTQNAT